MKLTHAIILAAGLGTRMRPLTDTIPKPLIRVQGKPLIDWCLDWLREAGIAQIVVNSSYRAVQLEEYLTGRNIHFSREEPAPLETGGGIARALPLLGTEPFLAMNSDAIFAATAAAPRHAISVLEEAWDDSLDFLMLVVPRSRAIGWDGPGDFILNETGELRRPNPGEEAPYIFTGVEIIHPRAFNAHPQGAFSLSVLWKQRVRADGFYDRMRAVVYDGDWLNVGDLAGLATAERYLGN